VSWLLFALGLAALTYQVLALISMSRFFRTSPPSGPASGPGITVFKPVKGVDAFTRECLESFFIQDYRPYQVLFGVDAPRDPAIPLLEDLQRAHPQVHAEIIVCPQSLGANNKVSKLLQMEPRAGYDILVISDADVQAGPDFLSRAAAALKEPGAGLVTFPYRAAWAPTLGGALEALTIAGDFIPSVAVAYYLEGVRFALGAAMVLPRKVLAEIGGLAVLADYLADDYQLGRRVAQAGHRVRLIPYVVETRNQISRFQDYLSHQLRWARTYRVCRPKGYLAYGVTHALAYSGLFALAQGPTLPAIALLAAVLWVRGWLAYLSQTVWLRGELSPMALLLLPLKDLLAFGLWVLSFLGNRVTWGGRSFRVTQEGKLVLEE